MRILVTRTPAPNLRPYGASVNGLFRMGKTSGCRGVNWARRLNIGRLLSHSCDWTIRPTLLYRYRRAAGSTGDQAMAAPGPIRKFKSIDGGKRLSRLPVASALRTLDLECEGLGLLRSALSSAMARPFEAALQAMRAARGRVIVSGIGKSGHVGQ